MMPREPAGGRKDVGESPDSDLDDWDHLIAEAQERESREAAADQATRAAEADAKNDHAGLGGLFSSLGFSSRKTDAEGDVQTAGGDLPESSLTEGDTGGGTGIGVVEDEDDETPPQAGGEFLSSFTMGWMNGGARTSEQAPHEATASAQAKGDGVADATTEAEESASEAKEEAAVAAASAGEVNSHQVHHRHHNRDIKRPSSGESTEGERELVWPREEIEREVEAKPFLVRVFTRIAAPPPAPTAEEQYVSKLEPVSLDEEELHLENAWRSQTTETIGSIEEKRMHIESERKFIVSFIQTVGAEPGVNFVQFVGIKNRQKQRAVRLDVPNERLVVSPVVEKAKVACSLGCRNVEARAHSISLDDIQSVEIGTESFGSHRSDKYNAVCFTITTIVDQEYFNFQASDKAQCKYFVTGLNLLLLIRAEKRKTETQQADSERLQMSQLSQHRANLHKLNEAGAHLTSEESAQTASFFAEHRASGAHEESKSSRRLSIYGTTGVVDTAETRALRRAANVERVPQDERHVYEDHLGQMKKEIEMEGGW
mmetsp:Transcript_27064/g.63265  ORF Transcript_27064/g.63265 Transcript_27064/m.63265 type:complete len:542 (-) Transcript_27064:153-1778(-)